MAALDLTLYEVANVVVSGWRSPHLIAPAIALVLETTDRNVVRVDEPLLADAGELAVEAGLTVYDAAYAACARRHGWTLVSGDVRDLVRPGFARTPAEVAPDVP